MSTSIPTPTNRAAGRKRALLLFLLLLLLAFVAWYVFLRPGHTNTLPHIRQGQTTITNRSPEFKIWDFSAEDGDTVNVYFDEALIFKNLGLQYAPVVYKPGLLSKGDHVIAIEAVNEGLMGPASPHISISDKDTVLEIDVDSWIDSARSAWVITIK